MTTIAVALFDGAEELDFAGPWEVLAAWAQQFPDDDVEVVTVAVSPEIDNFTVFDVSNALRERGWRVPAYTFPENRTDLAALRVVVERGFSHDVADLLVRDLQRQLPRLQRRPEPVRDAESASSFRH